MAAAAAMSLPNHLRPAKLPSGEGRSFPAAAGVVSFPARFHRTGCGFGRKLYSRFSLVRVDERFLFRKFERTCWQIRSNVDSSGVDPSPSSSTGSGTRLVRAIQALQTRLGARIQEIRKNLPMKLLFFLVGFYCATAFATVIGQTGDWDILSAALAVVVVEGIGALMYRASFPVISNIKSLITMFNYWKAGLSLGLFLDSFKYEIENIVSFSNPFYFEMDIFPTLL